VVFALWGTDPKYNLGALANADLISEHYPGWVGRFYVAEDAPALRPLQKHRNCQVVVMKPPQGWLALFWRLLPALEPHVDALIFRDCDSRLSNKESRAVQDWINSPYDLHVIRDVREHLEVSVVPSGLWGMVGGAVPDLHDQLWAWLAHNYRPDWSKEFLADERFLAETLWQRRRKDFLVHGWGGVPFPPHLPLKYGQFCGHPLDARGDTLARVPEERIYRGATGAP
jgi:hypothetical protein